MTGLTEKIKNLLKTQPQQAVFTAHFLAKQGFSYLDLSRSEKNGWLKRFANGAYTILERTLTLEGAIYALQTENGKSIHIGGRSALESIYGMAQYASERPVQLFYPSKETLPGWFTGNFNGKISAFSTSMLPSVSGLEQKSKAGLTLLYPSPERALLEMLYTVGKGVDATEAYEIMQEATSIKPAAMQMLLEKCTSVKVKRLSLCYAKLCGHQWYKKLNVSKVDLGSGARVIEKGGAFNKEFNLILPKELL